LCRRLKLFGGELVGLDGSKFSSVNHNSKVLSAKDIANLIKQIDENIEEYFCNLEKQDAIEEPIEQTSTDELNAAISKLKNHRESLSRLQNRLKNPVSHK
jgi:RNA binding exosome subunit